jgi:hypothetical protein
LSVSLCIAGDNAIYTYGVRYIASQCDILLRNAIYFPVGNAKVCSCGAIIIYVKATFKAHIKLPKAYHLRDKLQDLSHIARKHIARHHKLRLTLSVRYHEKLFCSAVAPLSQKAILPFGIPLVHIASTKLTYRDRVIYFPNGKCDIHLRCAIYCYAMRYIFLTENAKVCAFGATLYNNCAERHTPQSFL